MLTKFRGQEGSVIVEFAISLPLILALLFGIIEYGVLLYNKQVLTNASREVARAAINPVPFLPLSEIADAAEPYNGLFIRFGPYETISVTPPNANRTYPQQVTVSVTWDHYFLTPLLGLDTKKTLNVQTISRMM